MAFKDGPYCEGTLNSDRSALESDWSCQSIDGAGRLTHMLLLDLSSQGLRGQQLQDGLAEVNLTSNRNPIPFDSSNPAEWAGLRLGVGAATTRGLPRDDFGLLGEIIGRAVARCSDTGSPAAEDDRQKVLALCKRYPLY